MQLPRIPQHGILTLWCALLVSGLSAGCTSDPEGLDVDIPGVWEVTLSSEDTASSPETYSVIVTQDGTAVETLVMYDDNEVAVGYQGSVDSSGNMSLVQIPDDDKDTLSLATASLQVGNNAMTGTLTLPPQPVPEPLPTWDGTATHPKFLQGDCDDDSTCHSLVDLAPQTFSLVGTRVDRLPESSFSIAYQGLAGQKSFKDMLSTICGWFGSLSSFAIGILTDNALRPMGGCWGVKDGGGFYLFGQNGPGSLAPLWTTTVYFPWETAVCTERSYSFHITTGSKVMGADQLIALLKSATYNTLLGVFASSIAGNPNALANAIQNLYDRTGGFAVSVGFSTRNGAVSLYLNTVNSDIHGADVSSIPILSGIQSALGVSGSKFYRFAGNKISDSYHLRRSVLPPGIPFGNVCNTPIIFQYLFGTHSVKYD